MAIMEIKFALSLKISNSTTNTSLAFKATNTLLTLKFIPYIYYLLYFQKNSSNIKTLIDSSYEINVMTPVYAKKLNLHIWKLTLEYKKLINLV